MRLERKDKRSENRWKRGTSLPGACAYLTPHLPGVGYERPVHDTLNVYLQGGPSWSEQDLFDRCKLNRWTESTLVNPPWRRPARCKTADGGIERFTETQRPYLDFVQGVVIHWGPVAALVDGRYTDQCMEHLHHGLMNLLLPSPSVPHHVDDAVHCKESRLKRTELWG